MEGKADGLGIESVELEDGTVEKLYAGRFCDGVRHGYGVVLRGVGDFFPLLRSWTVILVRP